MPYIASSKVKLQFEENSHGYPTRFRREFESAPGICRIDILPATTDAQLTFVVDFHPVTFLKS